jgi:hypothetical protein
MKVDEVRIIGTINLDKYKEWREKVKSGEITLNKEDLDYYNYVLRKTINYRKKFKSVIDELDINEVYFNVYVCRIFKREIAN